MAKVTIQCDVDGCTNTCAGRSTPMGIMPPDDWYVCLNPEDIQFACGIECGRKLVEKLGLEYSIDTRTPEEVEEDERRIAEALSVEIPKGVN